MKWLYEIQYAGEVEADTERDAIQEAVDNVHLIYAPDSVEVYPRNDGKGETK